jgi:hypothetical protein
MEDPMTLFRTLAVAATLALTVSCGDVTGSTGEFGRIEYSLFTHYELDTSLVETKILTGHPQIIDVKLTAKGEAEATNAEQITHSVSPAAGVSLTLEDSPHQAPDLYITVSDPGTYLVESILNGAVFDRIDLQFESPTEYELITWLRERNDDEFEGVTDVVTAVTVGDQAAFLPVPYDADGTRLAGEMELDMSASPEWAVTQGFNVFGIYEQRVSGGPAPISVYFIEPGAVDIAWADSAHGISVSHSFEVEAINQ